MKIGIGYTTFKRRSHIELCRDQVNLLPPSGCDCTSYVISDEDGQFKISEYSLYNNETAIVSGVNVATRKGVAFRKTQCLKALKDCDYIFLFDDDCFPIKEGWAEYFIEAHKASGQHHFLYLKETSSIIAIRHVRVASAEHLGSAHQSDTMPPQYWINSFNNCGGCMMFLTKEAIEKVGAFGSYPQPYGFEHAGYSQRIHKAGLTPMGAYLCPAGASDYIYSMDYQNHLPFNKRVNHKSSVNVFEADAMIKENAKYFHQDINQIYQPL